MKWPVSHWRSFEGTIMERMQVKSKLLHSGSSLQEAVSLPKKPRER